MRPFATDSIAAGYATSRPAVHPRVLDLVRPHLRHFGRARRALDVGCGAGLSTRALQGFADQCIGLEPERAMLRWAPSVAPGAEFVAGSAEVLPLAGRSVDLMTAAGSLNYVRLEPFFREAARVLVPEGVLVVYDFSPGTSLRQTAKLDQWFEEFSNRYPLPAGEARALDPETLAGLDLGFCVWRHERFEIGLTLTPEFYLDYMMTESSVAAAVRGGVPREEIRSWCGASLGPIWEGREHEVIFRGYWACMGQIRGSGPHAVSCR